MIKDPAEYTSIIPALLENRFSIDRLTLLIYSPGFSLHDVFDDAEGFQAKRKLEAFRDFLTKLIDRAKQKNIQVDEVQNSMETKLYAYHYRIFDIDIQFCTRLPKTKKVDDQQMIEVFGDDDDKENGYMYEFYSNDYNVRIEYNPNKADFALLSEVVFFVSEYFYKEHRTAEFIKITRVDFAFDYPLPLSPSLITFAKSRKYNICGGSDGIETCYYGAQKSTFSLVIYDKKKEYAEKDNALYSGAYLWRIELRCRHTWFIQYLPGISFSVLPRIEIFSAGLTTDDWTFNFVVRDAMHWGIKSSLASIPDRTRQKYLKMFREYSANPLEHPHDLYMKYFRNVWDLERDKILKTFGFSPSEFCSRAVKDSKL